MFEERKLHRALWNHSKSVSLYVSRPIQSTDLSSKGLFSNLKSQTFFLPRVIWHDIHLNKTLAWVNPDSNKLCSKMFMETKANIATAYTDVWSPLWLKAYRQDQEDCKLCTYPPWPLQLHPFFFRMRKHIRMQVKVTFLGWTWIHPGVYIDVSKYVICKLL